MRDMQCSRWSQNKQKESPVESLPALNTGNDNTQDRTQNGPQIHCVVSPCVNPQHNTRQYRTSQTGQVMDYKWNTDLITFPQHKTVAIQLKEQTTQKTWITETLVQSLLTLNITQDSPITAQTQHYTRRPSHSPHSILHKTARSLPTLNITQDSPITARTQHYTKQWSNGTQNELQKHQASCCPLSV